jgi:hypothetical protein
MATNAIQTELITISLASKRRSVIGGVRAYARALTTGATDVIGDTSDLLNDLLSQTNALRDIHHEIHFDFDEESQALYAFETEDRVTIVDTSQGNKLEQQSLWTSVNDYVLKAIRIHDAARLGDTSASVAELSYIHINGKRISDLAQQSANLRFDLAPEALELINDVEYFVLFVVGFLLIMTCMIIRSIVDVQMYNDSVFEMLRDIPTHQLNAIIAHFHETMAALNEFSSDQSMTLIRKKKKKKPLKKKKLRLVDGKAELAAVSETKVQQAIDAVVGCISSSANARALIMSIQLSSSLCVSILFADFLIYICEQLKNDLEEASATVLFGSQLESDTFNIFYNVREQSVYGDYSNPVQEYSSDSLDDKLFSLQPPHPVSPRFLCLWQLNIKFRSYRRRKATEYNVHRWLLCNQLWSRIRCLLGIHLWYFQERILSSIE